MQKGTRFSKTEDDDLREYSSFHVSPSCMAMTLGKPLVNVIKRLSELGLRKKKGFKEYDSQTNEWG